jgi:cell division protein FtsW
MTLPPLFARGPLFAATAVLLALLSLLQLLCLWRAPALWSPAAIEVRLAAGAALTLGREALAAPQADAAHLALRREGAGRWFIGNASAGKQLLLQRADGERRMGSTPLRAGQQFQIGAARFEVSAAGARALSFAAAGEQWQYDGALLLRNGSPLPACPDAAPGARLLALWNRWAPSTLSVARPISFGGNLYCGNRLGVANVAPGSATLAASGGDVLLAAASGESTRMPLLVDGADLSRNEEALDGVTALVAGRTRLGVQLDGERLTLAPLRHVALFDQPRVQLPPAVAWQWRQRGFWTLPAGPAWLAAAMLAAALAGAAALSWQRGRWPFERGTPHALRWGALSTALLAIAGMAALMLQRAGTPPGAGVSVLLGGAALWCCLLLPGRPRWSPRPGCCCWRSACWSSSNWAWARWNPPGCATTRKRPRCWHSAWAPARTCACGCAEKPPPRCRSRGSNGCWPAGRRGALAALLLQVAFGDETGVFDLQPVEFAKLALTAADRPLPGLGLGWHAACPNICGPLLRWLRLAAPALLFLALLGVALVQVDDYSPLILLLVWAAAMALAWSLAAAHGGGRVLALCLRCAAAGGRLAAPCRRRRGGAQLVSMPTASWSGSIRPATRTPASSCCWARAPSPAAAGGARTACFGLSALGQGAGAVLAIPAVQDDFAPSFFLNRHGLAGALAAVALQALFLAALLLAAVRAFAASSQRARLPPCLAGRFRCFVLCGGAAFVLGHFLLSWGTNLAIFPIMGQPMSFLSAGGSHLLFFICPLLALGAISAQSLEEIPSCRSMSNTKPRQGQRRVQCRSPVAGAGLALFARRPLLRDLLERSPREQRGRAATRCFSHVTLVLPQDEVDDDRHLTRGARVRDLAQSLAALHQKDFGDLLGGDEVRYDVVGADTLEPGEVEVKFGHAVYLPAPGEKILYSVSVSRDSAVWKPVCPIYPNQRLALIGSDGDSASHAVPGWPFGGDGAILLINDGPDAPLEVQVRPKGRLRLQLRRAGRLLHHQIETARACS